ncbi:transposase [Rhodococcus opacus]|nr:transposase [Rhodococcus opacus]
MNLVSGYDPIQGCETKPKRYSEELRGKVLNLVAAGRPIAEIAHDLQVSDQTSYSWRTNRSSLRWRSLSWHCTAPGRARKRCGSANSVKR